MASVYADLKAVCFNEELEKWRAISLTVKFEDRAQLDRLEQDQDPFGRIIDNIDAALDAGTNTRGWSVDGSIYRISRILCELPEYAIVDIDLSELELSDLESQCDLEDDSGSE